jgi:branched-chain amino acid transport system permease protein
MTGILSDQRLRRALWAIVLAGVVVFLYLAPSLVPLYYMSVVTRIVIIGAFAVAFNIVFGMGGMPSLGHAAFFGVGGYAVGLGVTRWDWGIGTIVLVTLAAGALMGLVYGVLCQRVAGVYLLLMTLALGQAVFGLAFQNARLTGGDMGISGMLRSVLPFDLTAREDFHRFAVLVCVAVIGMLWWFMVSPVGRAIVGLRESETRMASLGYNPGLYKLAAFVVSGMACSFIGALYAFQRGFVGIDNLEWTMSATVLLAAIVGGARHFLGPAVGVAVIVALEAYVMEYTDRYTTVLGLFYMVTILFLPDGILGLRRRKSSGAAPTDALAELDAVPPQTEKEVVS